MDALQLLQLGELIVVLCGLVPLAFLIRRLCEILNFSYSTESNIFCFPLKAKLWLGCTILFFQLLCGVYHLLWEEDSSQILQWGLLLAYVIVPTTGWIISSYILILLHRVRLYTQEFSILSFWLCYAGAHLAVLAGRLGNVIKSIKPFEWNIVALLLLHVLCLIQLVAIILINFLVQTEVNSSLTKKLRPKNFSITDQTKIIALSGGIKAYINKWKLAATGSDTPILKFIVNSRIEGKKVKVVRTYKNFYNFDLKLSAKYKGSIKRGKYWKPKLPKDVEKKEGDYIKRLQYKLNQYLLGLCKDPKKELIKFLSIENYPEEREGHEYYYTNTNNDTISRITNSEMLVPEKMLEQTAQASENASQYLKHIWCCEDLVIVAVKLTYSSITESIAYIISVSYKDSRYNTEKSLMEIADFYSRLKSIFRGTPIPELPAVLDKASLEKTDMLKIGEWFQSILNDADFLCSDLQRFFGCEFMGIFPYIYQLNRIHYRQPRPPINMQDKLGFSLVAKVPLYKFQIDESNKDLRISFHIELELTVQEAEGKKTSDWTINKKYINGRRNRK